MTVNPQAGGLRGKMIGEIVFKFYDYDNNGNIGSVDILNLLKHFNTDRVDQIASNQERIYQLKQ